MTEKPLNEYIDLEAYDVVTGESYRALKEQLEALREAALAVCNATSYVTDDGRVVTGDVALDERVADLYRVLSNPAKEHRA